MQETVRGTDFPRPETGRWVDAKTYARFFSLSEQTLNNWRHLDRKAGRMEAAPGYPIYRRFGKIVRYLIPGAQ